MKLAVETISNAISIDLVSKKIREAEQKNKKQKYPQGYFSSQNDCSNCSFDVSINSTSYSRVKTNSLAASIPRTCESRYNEPILIVKGRIVFQRGP